MWTGWLRHDGGFIVTYTTMHCCRTRDHAEIRAESGAVAGEAKVRDHHR